MSELLSSITGGGGVFVAKASYPVEIISSGATGTIKTLTPPTGQRIKVTGLVSNTAMTSLTTITVGGAVVVSAVILEGTSGNAASSNEYVILDGMNEITGEVDEAFVFSTNVATSNNIELMYQEGVTA